MAQAELDTAAQRPATGLDAGARELILRVVGEVADLRPLEVAGLFFRDRFGGRRDYIEAVGVVRGEATSFRLEQAIADAAANAEYPLDFRRRVDPDAAGAHAMLINAPEPDFRTAVTDALAAAKRMKDASERITKVCRARGAPWAFEHPDGFVFTGDEETERELIRPALAAINRPEFGGGVRAEFASARSELATGTPVALKQAVHEAGNAVESAMKVVLDKHGVAYDAQRDTAYPLFEHLATAGIVPRYLQNLVLAPASPRNKKGGHGAGAIAHAVSPEEAESVVAAAAGAIAYLATRLP